MSVRRWIFYVAVVVTVITCVTYIASAYHFVEYTKNFEITQKFTTIHDGDTVYWFKLRGFNDVEVDKVEYFAKEVGMYTTVTWRNFESNIRHP